MKRCDGRLLRSIGPFEKMIPYIMTRRSDAQVFAKQLICTDKISAYLKEKRQQGRNIRFLHFFIAIYVRVIAERPYLNRFVMNSRLYERDGIFISMAVKRSLNDEAEETTVKFSFTGRENVFEVAEIVERKIREGILSSASSNVDRIASMIMSLPGKKVLVGILKAMDRHSLLPKLLINVSPFHTSLFFTYLKSINLDYIYHHLYDFGTTGIFVALGKVKKVPVAEDNAVVVKSCCEIGYTLDERICDGLYFANSLKLVKKYLEDPWLLEKAPADKARTGKVILH